jgi:hypothetical protein
MQQGPGQLESKQDFSPPNTDLKIAAQASPKAAMTTVLASSQGFPQARSWLHKFWNDSAPKYAEAKKSGPF